VISQGRMTAVEVFSNGFTEDKSSSPLPSRSRMTDVFPLPALCSSCPAGPINHSIQFDKEVNTWNALLTYGELGIRLRESQDQFCLYASVMHHPCHQSIDKTRVRRVIDHLSPESICKRLHTVFNTVRPALGVDMHSVAQEPLSRGRICFFLQRSLVPQVQSRRMFQYDFIRVYEKQREIDSQSQKP
jgi:hypothetical protein